jgi:P27 family predicted phage terminase small subunit
MANGRKPVPGVLRRLHGNPRQHKMPANEPEGVGDIWAPPAYMDDAQREQWDHVVAHAPPGLLTGTDRDILAAFVNAVVEYNRAVVQVRSMGQVVKTKDGNAIQNPFLGIMNRQALLIAKFGSEMGFSPASRASLGARAPEFSHETGARRTIRGSLATFAESNPDAKPN